MLWMFPVCCPLLSETAACLFERSKKNTKQLKCSYSACVQRGQQGRAPILKGMTVMEYYCPHKALSGLNVHEEEVQPQLYV